MTYTRDTKTQSRKPICLIPARAGSKRIAQKNSLSLAGHPLLSWTIACAQKSQLFDQIYVSSESSEILDIATKYGATPLLRPSNLARDQDNLLQLCEKIVPEINAQQTYTDLFLLLPTSPFRKTETIQLAWEKYLEHDATALLSLKKLDYPPQWAITIRNQEITPLFSESYNLPRTQLEPAFKHDGCILVIKLDHFFKYKTWSPPGTIGFEVSDFESIDLDEPKDWEQALYLQQKYHLLNAEIFNH